MPVYLLESFHSQWLKIPGLVFRSYPCQRDLRGQFQHSQDCHAGIHRSCSFHHTPGNLCRPIIFSCWSDHAKPETNSKKRLLPVLTPRTFCCCDQRAFVFRWTQPDFKYQYCVDYDFHSNPGDSHRFPPYERTWVFIFTSSHCLQLLFLNSSHTSLSAWYT